MESYDNFIMDLERMSLKAELFSLYRTEERNLRQKSKLNWLSLGDENSRFFHRFLAAKKRKNLIKELVGDQGSPTKSFKRLKTLFWNSIDH